MTLSDKEWELITTALRMAATTYEVAAYTQKTKNFPAYFDKRNAMAAHELCDKILETRKREIYEKTKTLPST
jgi:hypothetical protein